MYTLPTSFGPFFVQRHFSNTSFVGRKLSVLVTNCRSAFLPNRQHFCSSLAMLSSMTPRMSLGFPGTPNMMNKPRQSRPTRRQNSASFSNLLLFWKHLSANTASQQQSSTASVRPPSLRKTLASWKACTAIWSWICLSGPESRSSPPRTGRTAAWSFWWLWYLPPLPFPRRSWWSLAQHVCGWLEFAPRIHETKIVLQPLRCVDHALAEDFTDD